MIYRKIDYFLQFVKDAFPLEKVPLVQCITNVVTIESVANALLYIDAKPFMGDDPRGFPEFFQQNDSLFLNLGHISADREKAILSAALIALETKTPDVVDLVGVAGSKYRLKLARQLFELRPTVIKGNLSEMRAFCGLTSAARSVDVSIEDTNESAINDLVQAMTQINHSHPESLLLATGQRDLIVSDGKAIFLENGTSQLDRFTGTGDIVGALVTALLGAGMPALKATIAAISYFNLGAEKAQKTTIGLANFRNETLNQLPLLMNQPNWYGEIRGGTL